MSECGKYRYLLHARPKNFLNVKKPKSIVFIMINPSTADDSNDDRTIESCKRIAMHHECSDLYVLNIYPYRTKSVKELTEFLNSASQGVLKKMRSDNCYHMDTILKGGNQIVIAAWGKENKAPLMHELGQELSSIYGPFKCLGFNTDGSPTHPLYKSADSELFPFIKLNTLKAAN